MYPQYSVSPKVEKELDKMCFDKKIRLTGNSYTFDSVDNHYIETDFNPIEYYEYEYSGKKYIKLRVKTSNFFTSSLVSNGQSYFNNDDAWLEVAPLIWILDDKNKRLISKDCLVSGIKFCDYPSKNIENFEESAMYRYLDNYMLPDIIQSTCLIMNKDRKNISCKKVLIKGNNEHLN